MNNNNDSISEILEIPHQQLNPESHQSLESKSFRPLIQSNNNSSIQPPQSQSADQDQSLSYLNISFQEIINNIINNESPQLALSLKLGLSRAYLLVLAFLLYKTFAFYRTMNYKDRFRSSYFFFKLLSDCVVLYTLFSLKYTIKEASLFGQGEVSQSVVEYLKYTIRNNQPIDEEDEEDDQLTSAQWVARSLSKKVSTIHLLNYLLNEQSAHFYSVNRIVLLTQIILFIWGNSILFNQILDFPTLALVYTLIPGYMMLVVIILILLLVCLSIPILVCLILWQLCCTCIAFQRLCQLFRSCMNQRAKRRFLDGLKTVMYNQVVGCEECAICLSQFEITEKVIQLPCNVKLGNGQQINHIFHDSCIRVWIEEQGNCPICRKRFIEILHEE